jgi:glutaredoxin-related protein
VPVYPHAVEAFQHELMGCVINIGIKEYSDWPTIPQLYLDREFIGGCDILISMHQNGELAKLLEEKGVLVPSE